MSWFGRQLQTINVGANTTDTTDDKTLTFTYDASGLRGTKTVTTGNTKVKSEYVYVNGLLAYEKRGNSELFFFYDTYGHLTAFRYYADASSSDYVQYYAITNSMGDVIGFVHGNGTIVAKYEYDAWGNCEITQDTTSAKIATLNPIRYRGYYLDSETGFYYLQSRYYDPAIGRFLNADTIDVLSVSPTGMTDKNLFSYCDNNPVSRKDTQGNAWETVFDVISLGMSIADVAVNPTNPWAWAGLVGDVVDVAIPFVGGVGEVIKCCGTINKVSGVIDAASDAKKLVSKSVGTYEIMYKSGKNYVGKGTFNRAIQSAKRYTAPHKLNNNLGDEVLSITWKKAANNKEAFITEYLWQHRKNGVLSSNSSAMTYNKIWSPGRMLLGWF